MAESASAAQMAFNPIWIVVVLAVGGGLIAIGKWIGSVNTDRKSFHEFMTYVRDKLDKILDRLPPPPAVQANSPVSLTEFGEKISNGLSVKAWAAKEAPSLVDEARGKQEFEIFEDCVSYVSVKLDVDEDLRKAVPREPMSTAPNPNKFGRCMRSNCVMKSCD